MFNIYIFILTFSFYSILGYITSNQWVKINSILTKSCQNTILPKLYVNQIIFKHYEIWAYNQCLLLKNFHYYKCKHISKEEIKLYSQIGLHKAIMAYNPLRINNNTFSKYAYIYIRCEFYKCITELYPISIVSKSERRKGYFTRQNKIIVPIPSYSDTYQEIGFNKYAYKNFCETKNFPSYDDLWLKIEYDLPITNTIKRIIKLKYTYEFNQKRSNKEIGLIMGCSEETIRKHIVEFKNACKKQIF
jgi:hypothetical protein